MSAADDPDVARQLREAGRLIGAALVRAGEGVRIKLPLEAAPRMELFSRAMSEVGGSLQAAMKAQRADLKAALKRVSDATALPAEAANRLCEVAADPEFQRQWALVKRGLNHPDARVRDGWKRILRGIAPGELIHWLPLLEPPGLAGRPKHADNVDDLEMDRRVAAGEAKTTVARDIVKRRGLRSDLKGPADNLVRRFNQRQKSKA